MAGLLFSEFALLIKKTEKIRLRRIFPHMAVGVRFELTVPFQAQQFSGLPP